MIASMIVHTLDGNHGSVEARYDDRGPATSHQSRRQTKQAALAFFKHGDSSSASKIGNSYISVLDNCGLRTPQDLCKARSEGL